MEFFAIFTLKLKKKGSQDYEPRKFGCHGVLVRLSLKNHGRNYTILQDHEFANSRQQLEAKARELRVYGYGEVKNIK